LQRGLLELAFGFFADLAFEIGVGRREKTGVTRIDFCASVVDAGAEEFGGGQVDGNFLALDLHIAGLQIGEIYTSDHFAVDHKEQPVAGQKFWQVGVVVFTGNDFVHGVADGFEALELLDLANYRGLIHVEEGTAAAQIAKQVV
jgi:hypothetical protein